MFFFYFSVSVVRWLHSALDNVPAEDLPIFPFLSCLKGAEDKEGALRVSLECRARGRATSPLLCCINLGKFYSRQIFKGSSLLGFDCAHTPEVTLELYINVASAKFRIHVPSILKVSCGVFFPHSIVDVEILSSLLISWKKSPMGCIWCNQQMAVFNLIS